jgi:hypothetical protein
VSFGARNAIGTKWFPSKKSKAIPSGVWIDARVVVGSKKFSFLSSKIERSSGACPPRRQSGNMCLNNFPILIFSRLLKNAHLRRYPHPSSLRRTYKYASLLRISGALYLGIFDQPLRNQFVSNLIEYPSSFDEGEFFQKTGKAR